MKARIFMYLFFFALLLAIYQYVNNKRYYKAKEEEITNLKSTIDELEADKEHFQQKLDSLNDQAVGTFSLTSNSKAREAIEDQDMSPDSVAKQIENQLISKNSPEADNPLVPYSGMAGVMKINRIKVLNNRWIMAEFTDGEYWGEALISYYFDDDNNLQFDTEDGVLYDN